MIVSEKYGVNPSMQVCFWCGEVMGLLMLGRMPNDAEAPRQMVFDYEPCDKCKESWSAGVCVIETSNTAKYAKDVPISVHNKEKLYPTGRMAVITKEAFHKMFNGMEASKNNMALMDKESFSDIFKDVNFKKDSGTK